MNKKDEDIQVLSKLFDELSHDTIEALLNEGYILLKNKGKLEVIERPQYGSVKLTFNDSIAVYKDTLLKNKIY